MKITAKELDKKFTLELCQALHRQHIEGITMLALADAQGVTAAYLSRRFKEFGLEVTGAAAQMKKRLGKQQTDTNTVTALVRRRAYKRAYDNMLEKGIRPEMIERFLSKD